jgi:hypothetical protein
MEESILALKPLHRVQHEGCLLSICIQTRTLLGDDSTGVVLQVEEVTHVLGQVGEVKVELRAGDVTRGLVVLLPLGLLLITNQEECKWCVGGNGEAAFTQRRKSHVRHPLDGVVNVVADDGSPKRCCRVDGYLHPYLTHIHAVDLEGKAVVAGDWPVVVESDESAQ